MIINTSNAAHKNKIKSFREQKREEKNVGIHRKQLVGGAIRAVES